MRRETRGGNDVLLSLNINLRCPTKLALFRAGVQKRDQHRRFIYTLTLAMIRVVKLSGQC